MSWGSQYYPPSTQLVIFHLPIAHPAGNVCPWAFANLDLNTRGKAVILLTGSEYQIHVYNWDSKLLLKLLILENRQFLPSWKEGQNAAMWMHLYNVFLEVFLPSRCFWWHLSLLNKHMSLQTPHLMLSNWKKKHILSSAAPCLQEKSFNFSTFSLECYLETFSS